jgi:phospholipase B1
MKEIDTCGVLQTRFSAENYANNIKQALDILHHEVPKAFVNVVLIFDIAPIAAIEGDIWCDLVHW